ncbi:MAG: VWA domain-containing protein [Phycisphaerae bacterium]
MVNTYYLLLLLIIPFLLLPLMLLRYYLGSRARMKLADTGLQKRLCQDRDPVGRFIKSGIVLLAVALIIIGLCRPRWNAKLKTVTSRGRDVVILLDVSRSMLAEDIKPNRLERAKLAITDLIEHLSGDRVGVVVFSGDATVRCPLTQDYGFIKLILGEIGPEITGKGGTNLGDAIRMATDKVFDNTPKDYKDIILITDGGDLESSLPVEAAASAGENGIRIIAIGLGDKTTGARIPVTDDNGSRSFLEYNGEQVWTKLEDDLLRQTAMASSEGKYIPVGTGTFNLGEIYEALIAGGQKRELEEKEQVEYEEKFQIFLCGAFVLLAGEMVMNDRKKSK